jgi:polyphosphate kinase
VFYFYNGGKEDVYLSSADWMDRNFFRRIEVCFPVVEPRLKKRVFREGLKPFLARNIAAWEMDGSGKYKFHKGKRGKMADVQTKLLKMLAAKTGG